MALSSSLDTFSKYSALNYRDGLFESSRNPVEIRRNSSRFLVYSTNERTKGRTIIGSLISTSFRRPRRHMDPCKDEVYGKGDPDPKDEERRKNWVEIVLQIRKRRKRITTKEDDFESYDVAECGLAGNSEMEAEVEIGESMVYTRESFLNFLSPVPRYSIKLYSKLSFLSSAAYTIPKLKSMDMRSRYGLRFVTSSMEKKAEANTLRGTFRQEGKRESSVSNDPPKDSSEREDRTALDRLSFAHDIASSAATYLRSRTKGLSAGGDEPQGSRKECSVVEPEVAASVAATAITALVAAEEKEKDEAVRDLRSARASPCEWFICDDIVTTTRYVVIQAGSGTKESWQANLLFEPVIFEGTEALVHRGVYEAAKGIYEQLLPEITEFLSKNGEQAKLQFTGHSLGGSLAVLVHLILIIREVAKPLNLQPVVTFGAPFVLCRGDKMVGDLGLGESIIHSIMMHRDIVPRAFSCDYPDQISTLLKRLNGRFRTHPCLVNERALYAPLGRLLIVQPEDGISPAHPMLPEGAGIYRLEEESAVRAFMNCPHPVQVLSNPGAYGSKGTISRDHDSVNYIRALTAALKSKKMRKK